MKSIENQELTEHLDGTPLDGTPCMEICLYTYQAQTVHSCELL